MEDRKGGHWSIEGTVMCILSRERSGRAAFRCGGAFTDATRTLSCKRTEQSEHKGPLGGRLSDWEGEQSSLRVKK